MEEDDGAQHHPALVSSDSHKSKSSDSRASLQDFIDSHVTVFDCDDWDNSNTDDPLDHRQNSHSQCISYNNLDPFENVHNFS